MFFKQELANRMRVRLVATIKSKGYKYEQGVQAMQWLDYCIGSLQSLGSRLTPSVGLRRLATNSILAELAETPEAVPLEALKRMEVSKVPLRVGGSFRIRVNGRGVTVSIK